MQKFIISFLIGLLCSLQVGAFAETTQTIHIEWGYTAPSSPTVTGFKLYQEGALACHTQNPNATTLDCQVSLTKDTTNFTLTATFSDNTESPHSAPFPYTIPSGASLTAVITTNATSGTAPLAISFNASASTGTIASYLWDFGDGSTATTQSASHTYANAGTYAAKLTIADASGKTSIATTTITVASAPTPVPTTPPTAVISSSAATGPAPLAVSLDGSGSTATNATIAAYNWSFGDGTTASGAKVAHSYTSAGTYSATLTVTDSKGLSSQASTPVIATTPTATNTAPKAVISATPISGTAPLAVTFNGGNSTDSDGSIAGYTWNFGDGSTASGKTVSHTYTTNATFTATLEVVDDKGAKGSASTTIAVAAQNQTPQLKIETGEVAVSSTWVRVPLETTFANPIVVAGPPSFNNNQPCVVQLRNVDATGFDVRIKEWNYLDGTHPLETISYIVMEKGRHALPDGSSVEAGTFAGSTSFKTIAFSKAFSKAPVVLTTVASAKEADTISGRLKSITTSGFAYYYREQERNRNTHTAETINYIAWEPGKGTIGSVQFEVGKTASTVTNTWSSITYQSTYATPPLLIADMQTTTELDTSALRVQQMSASGFQIKVEEEQSKDSETTHKYETIGYLALNQVETTSTVPVRDDFNRTDGPLGAEWTTFGTGTFQIVNNQLKNTASFKTALAVYTGRLFSSNQYVQINATNTSSSIILIRYDPASNNGYQLNISSGNTILSKISNGVSTAILPNFQNPISNNDVVKLVASDSSFEVFLNNISIGKRIDLTHANGSPGVAIYNTFGAIDNFESGEL